MNRAELFKKTVDVLYKAYKHKHLKHMTACGCAVGNLIYHGLHNENFHKSHNESVGYYEGKHWFGLLYAKANYENINEFFGVSQQMSATLGINSTGYSEKEIQRIEAAFEGIDPEVSLTKEARDKCSSRQDSDPTSIHGLMDVIDALGEIHEAPAVADCLKKAISSGNYNFETEEFKKLYAE